MTLAYLISAHTDAPQLARLIRALDSDAHFFVHIDRKSDIRPFQELCGGENVHFLTERIDVRWATFLQVDYQLLLLRAALAHPMRFHRLIMLSGLDYPLVSSDAIRQWIASQGEQETLPCYCLNTPTLPKSLYNLYTLPRLLFRHLPAWPATKLSILCRRTMAFFGYHRPLTLTVGGLQWDFYKSSSWFCISEELAQYVVDTYDKHPIIRKTFEHTFGPDETMIPTIVMNSPQWAARCTLVQGKYPGLAALTPIHYIIYEPVIQIMTLNHLPKLKACGKLFARKFVSGQSDALVDALSTKTSLPLSYDCGRPGS